MEQEEVQRYRQRAEEAFAQEKETKSQLSRLERQLQQWRSLIAETGLMNTGEDDVQAVKERIHDLKLQNRELEQSLHVAQSAHSPTMVHYQALLAKCEQIERAERQRDRRVKEILEDPLREREEMKRWKDRINDELLQMKEALQDLLLDLEAVER